MSVHVRSVKVHVEVDTNKQTHVLDLPDADPDDVVDQVREFLADATGYR